MTRSLNQVTSLYACATEVQISERLVEDDVLRRYSSTLNDFQLALGEAVEEEQWQGALRTLRRLRFDSLAAPVTTEPLECDDLHAFLSSQRHRVRAATPDIEPILVSMLDALQRFRESPANPLLEAIAEVADRSGARTTPVLLSESRLRKRSQVALEKAGIALRVSLMTPPELRASSALDSLVVLGAPRWFPPHVFTAPRAANLAVVRHHWISVDWRRVWQPSFQIAKSEQAGMAPKPPVIYRDQASVDVILGEEGIPELEVRVLEDIPLGQSDRDVAGRPPGEGEVDAILLKLEDASLVLLEDDEGNQAYIVDLDEDDPIHRVPVQEVVEGVFILLRTEGGGDYVVDMADQLLREKAFPARAKQDLWKRRLRDAVTAQGTAAVVAELKRRGSRRANTSNLRNWQSPRNIKTQDRADFDAILALAGLGDQGDDLWQTMDLIDRAHSQAGQEIRRRLLAEVRGADRTQLIRNGRLEVELDEGGGSLAALRVQEVSRERYRVPRSQLNQVLPAVQTSLAS